MLLASQSPRRKELLQRLVPEFKTVPANIDESQRKEELPQDYVLRMSQEKAKTVQKNYPKELILASDTIVALDKNILGKPQDKEDAFSMLKSLSGKTHKVYTAMCLLENKKEMTTVESCDVTFYPLSDEDILKYLATEEYVDKAGSYGIQGQGALLIEKIAGDYYTVMGLPIAKLNRMLRVF